MKNFSISLLLSLAAASAPLLLGCGELAIPCEYLCEEGKKTCTDAGELLKCSMDADGCLHYIPIQNKTCSPQDLNPECNNECTEEQFLNNIISCNTEAKTYTKCVNNGKCLVQIETDQNYEIHCSPDSTCENPCNKPGQTQCIDSIGYECVKISDDCYSWSNKTEAAKTACSGNCTNPCSADDAPKCDNNIGYECVKISDDCYSWLTETEAAKAACKSECTNQCNQTDAPKCENQIGYECQKATNGCFDWVKTDNATRQCIPPTNVCQTEGERQIQDNACMICQKNGEFLTWTDTAQIDTGSLKVTDDKVSYAAIAVHPSDGSYIVFWANTGNPLQINAQKYLPGGCKSGEPVTIYSNTKTPNQLTGMHASMNASGQYAITWTNKEDSDYVLYIYTFDSNNTEMFTNRVSYSKDRLPAPSVAMQSNGKAASSWISAHTLNSYRFYIFPKYKTDSPVGSVENFVSDSAAVTPYYIQLTALSDTQFVVSTSDYYKSKRRYCSFKYTQGQTATPAFRCDNNNITGWGTTAKTPDGGYISAHLNSAGVVLQKYPSTSDDAIANAIAPISDSTTTTQGARICVDSAGKPTVAWQSGSKIKWANINNNKADATNEIPLDGYSALELENIICPSPSTRVLLWRGKIADSSFDLKIQEIKI